MSPLPADAASRAVARVVQVPQGAPGQGGAPAPAVGLGRRARSERPSAVRKSPPAKAPRRVPVARRRVAANRPSAAVGARPGSRPLVAASQPAANPPAESYLAGSRPDARARADPLPGEGPRRAVGGVEAVSSVQPFPSRRASAAAQLIKAMWVNACGKFPRNSPLAGSISSE
jgi:hypothetical protein